MNKEAMKRKVCEAIDMHRNEIVGLGERIFTHPELGYKETKTSALVQETFTQLGIPFKANLAVTGVKGRIQGRSSQATIGVLGELDAVVCYDHPACHPETGAVHCCGHHAQIAAMLAVGFGLVRSGIMSQLDGDLVLFAVPAEEYVELDYRARLQAEGIIQFFGGKQELIRLGEFDDVDISMMCHIESNVPGPFFRVGSTAAGFIGKRVRFTGREAHAGGAPHEGVNALNAALLALMGVHAQREAFRDDDHIRVHPIITRGGDLVNIVPADVRLETYVRGKSIDAILDANRRVNSAFKAGAEAIGANVEIEEIPGYLPMQGDPELEKLFGENAILLVGTERVALGGFSAVSGDNGDLQHIMPSIIPGCGGVSGYAHARDFRIADPEAAYILPAKAMAMTIVDLLVDGAARALLIKQQFKPRFDKNSYLQFWRSLMA